jgi:hypothetical protein
MRRISVVLLVLTLSFLAVAQTSTTSLRGTVTDSKGAVIPKASVTLARAETGFNRTVQTDQTGSYQFLQIPPGTYKITITSPAFAKSEQVVQLLVNLPATVNAKLSVEAASTTVDVSGEAPTVNVQDASLGNAFNNQQVLSLPFEGRDPVGILSLQPGVSFVGNNVDQDVDSRGGSVNGARSDQTNVTLDGVDNNDQLSGRAFTGALRSTLDSLQEFRVTTSNANAESGRSSGAQVALVTKSGTNLFHGSLYEYHRPTFTTANDPFNKLAQKEAGESNRPGKLLINTFGASVGGPLIKDRLFFFGTYEGQRQRQTLQVNRTVPSDELRQGIIRYRSCLDGTISCAPTDPTQIVTLNAAQIAAMDPSCAAAGTCPWGGGVNPNVLNAWQAYPHANSDALGDGLNFRAFTFAGSVPTNLNTAIARFDYNITRDGGHRLFLRANWQDDTVVPGTLNGAPQFAGQEANQLVRDNSKGVSLGYVAAFTSNVVNNLRYGFTRQAFSQGGPNQTHFVDFRGIDEPIGYNRSTAARIPVNNLVDDLTWTKGKHTIQFGGNWRVITNDRSSNAQNFFAGQTNVSWLDNASIANTGSSLDPAAFGHPKVADFFSSDFDSPMMALAGIVSQVTAVYNQDKTGTVLPEGSLVNRKFRAHEMEMYLQDTWRVTPSLVLTGGLRYALLQPPYEMNGNQVSPSISLHDFFEKRAHDQALGQVFSPIVSLDVAGQGNGRRPYWDWDYKNLGPRVAFAWSPSGDKGLMKWLFGSAGRSSIRGGWGIVFDHFGQGVVNSFDQNGSFGLTTSIVNPAGIQSVDGAPRFTNANTIPSSGASGSLVSPPPGNFPVTPPADLDFGFAITWGLDDKLKTPYSHQMDFSYSRELPGNFVFEAAYVGRLGRHLLQEKDLAQPLNLKDPASGQDYYGAATQLAKLAEAGTDINAVGNIPFWQNVFPTAGGPGKLDPIKGGCAPGVHPANPTATQNMYDMYSCFLHNETTGLFIADLLCVPACAFGGDQPVFFQKQWSSLYAWTSDGESSYHGAQLMLRHRMQRGLQFDFNYTLSKSIDTSSNAERISLFSVGQGGFGGQVINAWSPNQLRGPSDFDARHQINSNWVYEFPYGRGRHWGRKAGTFAEALFGSWDWSGLFRWTSGLPFSISPGLGNWPTNWELTGNVFLKGAAPKTGTFVDAEGHPNAFADPNAAVGAFRFAYPGESGQRNNLRGPGYFGIDMALSKTWHITERQLLSLRWETFNVTNSVRFDVGTMSFNNGSISNASNFGRYTQTLTKPRSMQFALRYMF